MPKIVSAHEKELILEAIYQNAIALIKKKGLRGVTVDDITQSVNIAKGSFYKYYPSKEDCLYWVIRRSEREVFNRMEALLSGSSPKSELIVRFFREIYISDDSLAPYLEKKDFDALLRKLPAEYARQEQEKSEDNFNRTLGILGITGERLNMRVLSLLMESLGYIASKEEGDGERKEAAEVVIQAIADYIIGK